MKNILTVGFLFFFGIGFSQHPGGGYCELQSENKAWAYKFSKTEDMAEKIELIQNKILADTEYFQENPEIANLDDRRVFGKIPCVTDCSIRFGIVYAKSKGLKLDLQKNPELEDLVYELNADNVSKFDVNMHHPNDRYSHKAVKRSGVLIYTEDKALKKKIRVAIREMEKDD